MSGPFCAWKELSASAVLRRNQQNRLVNAYVRWKQRQKHIRILQVCSQCTCDGGRNGWRARSRGTKSSIVSVISLLTTPPLG